MKRHQQMQRESVRDDRLFARVIEHNTDSSGPDSISATRIHVHLCANSSYPIEVVNQTITAALERGDLVEENGEYAPASPDTY